MLNQIKGIFRPPGVKTVDDVLLSAILRRRYIDSQTIDIKTAAGESLKSANFLNDAFSSLDSRSTRIPASDCAGISVIENDIAVITQEGIGVVDFLAIFNHSQNNIFSAEELGRSLYSLIDSSYTFEIGLIKSRHKAFNDILRRISGGICTDDHSLAVDVNCVCLSILNSDSAISGNRQNDIITVNGSFSDRPISS